MTQSRRLAALMFTDLVGYSALSEKNEALALELLEEHRQLLRPLFESHHGTEIKTIGDAFLVEFASAVEAARCAIAIQKALTAHTSVVAPERRIQVRIGLHVGDVVFEEGDVLGDGVNIASRIEPLAQPGGICVSGTVADQVKNKIGHPMESLGEKQLKNIKEPLTVYRIVLPWEEGMVPSKQARPALRKPTISRLVKVGFVAVVLVAAVGWWLASRGTPSIKPGEITSIAVLPLDNLMGDPDQDYFVDGMHEAIISNLARIGALKVISRTSTLGYRNTGKRIPQIARELGVDAIVEGSVLRAGDRVRITVQLIHGASDEHLWANDYEGDLTDILSLQKTVARAIAGEIKIILKPEEKAYLASTRQVNPEAYEAYLMGRYYWNKRTEEAFQKGVEYFQLAIEKDPTYALAYAGIADCYNLLQVYAYLPPKEAFPKARTAAEKALEIDSSLAEAHTSLAWVRWSYDLDWSAGEKEFKRALELNPGYATGHHWYSIYLTAMGRHAESLAQIKRAQEVDPLSLMINTDLGTVLFYGRQDDLAIEQYHKTLEMDKDFVVIYWRLAMFYAHKEMYNEANAAVQNMKELLGGEDPLFLATLGYIYSLSGKRNEAKKVLDELSELSKHRYIPSMRIALIYMGLGQKDQTFKWLEKAYEERDFWMTLIKVAPFLNRLRSDPRFQILLKKMNLELN